MILNLPDKTLKQGISRHFLLKLINNCINLKTFNYQGKMEKIPFDKIQVNLRKLRPMVLIKV